MRKVKRAEFAVLPSWIKFIETQPVQGLLNKHIYADHCQELGLNFIIRFLTHRNKKISFHLSKKIFGSISCKRRGHLKRQLISMNSPVGSLKRQLEQSKFPRKEFKTQYEQIVVSRILKTTQAY